MAENQVHWHHIGPVQLKQQSNPFLYNIPLDSPMFADFFYFTCFYNQQPLNNIFNGGHGRINAIYENTSNIHLGVDEDDYDNLPITIQYSPINLSFCFHCVVIVNENPLRGHRVRTNFHPTNLSIGSSTDGVQLNLTLEIDTDLYFRWVEPTESENQTQKTELHIRIIQERFPKLIPNYDDLQTWYSFGFNILPIQKKIVYTGRPLMIIFRYCDDDVLDKFLDSFPEGRMKDRINKGLAIRVPNVYCSKNDSREWTVLKGAQIKISTEDPKTLSLLAIGVFELDISMRRGRTIKTSYRWRDGYLEFRIELCEGFPSSFTFIVC
ncbi:unnamed protein product [Amaranthus hypochondriacus]